MITTKLNNGRVFLHNGDFSGDLIVNVEPAAVARWTITAGTGLPATVRVSVPFEDIKAIVAEYVRRETVRALEQASDDEVLFCTFDPTPSDDTYRSFGDA